MSMLEINEVSISFGGIKAVNSVSFSVEKGEVFSIIGPNGAGKTTVFNLISRFYNVDQGTIVFEGQDLTTVSTHQVGHHGIARTFQNTELFEHETVLNNLMIGHHVHRKTNLLKEIFYLSQVRNQDLDFRKNVEDVIVLMNLQI